MSTLTIETARVFKPLLKPARYKGAHGGRGSGKSHFFAEMLVEDALRIPGLRAVCIREVQKALKDSAKLLIEDKIQTLGVGKLFDVQREQINTPGGGVILFQGMQDHTAESIKSLERFQRAWVEEAQTLSERSLTMLRPTIRDEGSEIWASWNPRRKTDAIDQFLRGKGAPEGSTVIQANWRDNPWFPKVLKDERLHDKEHYPDRYEHIWEGDYVTIFEGAYFAASLKQARADGRIGKVPADPLMQKRAFWDIGVNDSTAIWIAQFVGREIRLLDYIEGQGQPLSYYVAELRRKGHGQALCVLPHDGAERDVYTATKYEDHLRDAGFEVQTVKNQGKGAAMLRIEAARRLFPACYFNEPLCGAGIDALGAYHERRDEDRNTGLGPEHDWASHGADAFGLLAIAYETPRAKIKSLEMPSFGAV